MKKGPFQEAKPVLVPSGTMGHSGGVLPVQSGPISDTNVLLLPSVLHLGVRLGGTLWGVPSLAQLRVQYCLRFGGNGIQHPVAEMGPRYPKDHPIDRHSRESTSRNQVAHSMFHHRLRVHIGQRHVHGGVRGRAQLSDGVFGHADYLDVQPLREPRSVPEREHEA